MELIYNLLSVTAVLNSQCCYIPSVFIVGTGLYVKRAAACKYGTRAVSKLIDNYIEWKWWYSGDEQIGMDKREEREIIRDLGRHTVLGRHSGHYSYILYMGDGHDLNTYVTFSDEAPEIRECDEDDLDSIATIEFSGTINSTVLKQSLTKCINMCLGPYYDQKPTLEQVKYLCNEHPRTPPELKELETLTKIIVNMRESLEEYIII